LRELFFRIICQCVLTNEFTYQSVQKLNWAFEGEGANRDIQQKDYPQSMDSRDVILCLQALGEELKSTNNLYDAHRVIQGIQLIRKQEEELRSLRGETDRRATKRYAYSQEIPVDRREPMLSLVKG
jgi:hypothetical protein